ncbi:MAG: phosphonoacetaldehyde reductase [Firmicutes bacterium]|nr:phosphonoacetaldehyde reductase [Bacillota bacterium]
MQKILSPNNDYSELTQYLKENRLNKIFLVCDSSLPFLKINDYFTSLPEKAGIEVVYFNDFKPNPLYESVVKGVDLFLSQNCDAIIAVGGGSAMDVAKCIKLYSNMDKNENYLKQTIVPNDIPLLAVPTTAGTGSEATRYAVIYYNDEKQSVADYSCIPSVILLDPSVLKTLPEYQKKSTMLDALCHSIEAFWSVNSTDESKEYSKQAIKLILENLDGYIKNEDTANANMLVAANTAGKAINITQTTAGHAMCYKLTSLYNIAHGHAAALCVKKLFPYMIMHTEKCIDPRGEDCLKTTFEEIAKAMDCLDANEAAQKFEKIVDSLNLTVPKPEQKDFDILTDSVNVTRLKNNPVELDKETIRKLYNEILA